MDAEYNIPGKYQRQLQYNTFQKLKENHKEQARKLLIEGAGGQVDDAVINEQVELEEQKLNKQIEQIA